MTRFLVLHLAFGSILAAMMAHALLANGIDLASVLGGQEPDATILIYFRAPRIALALATGAALGMAGTAMQVTLRNPLASPDIVGFGAGAAAGAAAAILLGGGIGAAPFGALAGGLATAAALVALAWRDGVAPLSLVLIGVALGLMLVTATNILLGFAPDLEAAEALRFLTGSFAAADWRAAGAMAGIAAAGGAALGWLAFHIDRLDMGDDMARALGLWPGRLRLAVAGIAALLVSTSVAVAGPLAFVAFLAGPLARMMAGRPGTLLSLSALIGATAALGADALSTVSFAGTRLPAGVFTSLIGGPAMIAILLRRAQKA